MYRINGNLRKPPTYATPSCPVNEVVHSVNTGKSTVMYNHHNPIKPEPFEGTAEELDDYLSDFELISSANKWTNEEMAQRLPPYLRGPWKKWYRNTYGASLCTSYKELKKNLQKALSGSLTKEKRLEKLFERKQQYGEDFDNYYFEKMDLITKVNPTMKDSEKVYHLTRGLAPHLVIEVQKFGPETPEEVRDIVSKISLGIAQANARKDYAQTAIAQFEAVHSVNTLAKKVDELSSVVSTINSNKRRQQETGRLCFSCGLPGHYASACPSKQTSRKREGKLQTPLPNVDNSRSIVTCEFCQRTGHVEAKCYYKHGFPPRQGKVRRSQ